MGGNGAWGEDGVGERMWHKKKMIFGEKMGLRRGLVGEKKGEKMGSRKGWNGEKICPWDGQWHVRRWAQGKDGA